MVVSARGIEGLVEEMVLVVLAEMIGGGSLVGLPVVQVKVHDAVAAKLGMQGVVIHARRMHVLAKEGIGVVFTDGLVDVFLHVGVNMERDADVDVGETIVHMTCVSGVTEAWCGNGMLRMGVAKCVGG